MIEQCHHEGCSRFAEEGRDECFTHRVRSVGFAFRAPALQGEFHRTKSEWMQEHLGTTNERELAERGIERVT